MKEKPIWKKNLFVLSIAVFIAGIAFSEIMPFLSLYINTLGNFSHQQLNFWSGIVYSGTFIVSAVVSPWWGKLADKKGRKPMILRAGIGMSVVIACMGSKMFGNCFCLECCKVYLPALFLTLMP